MPRNALHVQIQIARQQLRLDNDVYRAALERAVGKRSSVGLSDPERRKVLIEMKRLGFQARPTIFADRRMRRASDKKYVRLIFGLWGELKRAGIWREHSRFSLLRFVKDMTGKDDPEFLSFDEASKVIEALKAMKERKTT